MTNVSKTPRVLVVTPRYFPLIGGIETHVFEVSRRLIQQGVDVTVLTTNIPGVPLPREDEHEGVRVLRVPAWPRGGDYYFAPAISTIVERGGWDLVHCQGCHTFVPPLAMLAARRAGIPYMVTFHTGGHSSYFRTQLRGLQWRSLRPFFAHATKLIGVAQFEVDYFRTLLRLPAQRFMVIPNGSTLPHVESAGPPTGKRTKIVSIGRLERYKGHQRLITALPHILACRPETELEIIGKGPYKETLRRLAQKMGVHSSVTIRAIASGERQHMAETLAQAALVALLSEYEAHPIAIMEALALGRPALVADTSGLRELAQKQLVRAVPLRSSPEQVALAALAQIEAPLVPASVKFPTWDECARQIYALYIQQIRRPRCAF